MAGAGVRAGTPAQETAAAPVLPDSRSVSVDLLAFENPLALWGTTISNTLTTAGGLGHNIVAQTTALGEALGNPALHAEILEVLFSSVTNPLPLLTETLKFPFTYGGRIGAGLQSASAASWEAFSKLPEVLVTAAGYLFQGQFLAAWGQLNNWFLVDILSENRAGLLDALRVPGDFLESLGLDPLARILGTSWMDEGTAGPGYGAGLLSRAVIGNLGRALFAPSITAIFQTVEILDRARAALFSGDVVTLASELINAPAKIANAFLNGYVPAFLTDPDSPFPPDGPGRNFPGFFSPTGTLDFFLVQVPREIARALTMQRPQPAPESISDVSSTDIVFSGDTVSLTIDTVADEAGAPADDEAGDITGVPGDPTAVDSAEEQQDDGVTTAEDGDQADDEAPLAEEDASSEAGGDDGRGSETDGDGSESDTGDGGSDSGESDGGSDSAE